ncbi:hypothetical protein EVAR_33838_1 [Eumeta japonica]|uniref:Uncharacterized protein n=1 Tax=Eumeta variegata TaxID=151549 RepID=A0A4C1VDE0_EUMVA|nr:hypothetical protein EVAR_33838_1 [Eumeta japonica]
MISNKLDSEENIPLDDVCKKTAVDTTEEPNLELKSDNDALLLDKVVTSQPITQSTKVVQRKQNIGTQREVTDSTCCICLASCLPEWCNAVLPFCVLGCNGCLHGVFEAMVVCFESCGECCLMCQCVS